MQFLLTGFRRTANVRLYSFQSLISDRIHRQFTVGVDLNLARLYAISLQELPLLCRKLLEGQPVGEVGSLRFSEQEMLGIVERRAEAQREAEQKSKNRRRPPSSQAGQAWR